MCIFAADNRIMKTLLMKNDVNEVPRLNIFVGEVCASVCIDPDTAASVGLAVEEAVVNVINYAYPKGTEGDITLNVSATDYKLIFELVDAGKPFDPTTMDDPDTTLAAEERSIGGLGIFLMRQYMDAISYRYVDGCNHLSLIKNLNQ